MRKIGVIVVLAFLVFVSMSTFVSANFRADFNEAVVGAENGIRFLFGDVAGMEANAGEVLFIKFLVFILLFAILNYAIKKVPGFDKQKGVTLTAALVIAIIAVRFMASKELVNFIWLPYGALGVALSAMLPFLIGFFFIENFDNSLIRKIGWTAFLVIFGGLSYMRWDSLSVGTEWYMNLGMIYLIIAIISGLLIWFDAEVRKKYLKNKFDVGQAKHKQLSADRINRKIRRLTEELGDAHEEGEVDRLTDEINSLKAARDNILS